MPTNNAAIIPSSGVRPLQLITRPYPSPKAGTLVVRTHALAINPLDHLIQTQGTALMYNWLTYPFVLGSDLAGVVQEVGSGVTRFKVGDRVVAHATGTDKERNDPSMGAFQEFVVVQEIMCCPVPENMSFEQAAVVPMGVSTAAAGLWQDDMLKLNPPTGKAPSQHTAARKVVLITGGASSVGSNAIQLAAAAGYDVVTTCSPKNNDMVKRLGATHTFDYNSSSLQASILKVMQDREVVGAVAIGKGSAELCVDVLAQCKHARKFVSIVTYPQLESETGPLLVVRRVISFLSWNTKMTIKGLLKGVGWKFVFATTIVENGLGKVLYGEVLPTLLASGKFVPSPEPQVVGSGLEKVQEAMDMQKKGVSARKLVVTLP
jgi:NADPH:quinone reductase-like Zn-dependent oxidoreductase